MGQFVLMLNARRRFGFIFEHILLWVEWRDVVVGVGRQLTRQSQCYDRGLYSDDRNVSFVYLNDDNGMCYTAPWWSRALNWTRTGYRSGLSRKNNSLWSKCLNNKVASILAEEGVSFNARVRSILTFSPTCFLTVWRFWIRWKNLTFN